LRPDDVLMTKNAETGRLEWQQLTGLTQKQNYEGELVQFESNAFSAVTTPEHRWLVFDKASKKDRCVTTDNISLWGDHRIHRAGVFVGSNVQHIPDDIVELAGWILTDGHLKSGTSGTTSAYVCQSKPDEIKQIDALFERLGLFDEKCRKPGC